MNKTTVGIISGLAGALVGGGIAWKIVDLRYSKIVEEEIQSVRDILARNNVNLASEEKSSKTVIKDTEAKEEVEENDIPNTTKPSLNTFYDECKKRHEEEESYSDDDEKAYEEDIFQIDAEIFGEEIGHETQTLFWFDEEKVLASCDDRLTDLEEIKDVVGTYEPEGFDEQDLLYIRNKNHLTDYEIIKCEGTAEEFFIEHSNLVRED